VSYSCLGEGGGPCVYPSVFVSGEWCLLKDFCVSQLVCGWCVLCLLYVGDDDQTTNLSSLQLAATALLPSLEDHL